MDQYTIQSGDTLSGIASRFGLNWNDLQKWNNIADPHKIYAGRTLSLNAPLPAQNIQQPISSSYNPPTPSTLTPFSQILDMSKVFPQELIGQFAREQVAPDIERSKAQEMTQLSRDLAKSGAYRSGYAPFAQKQLMDTYARSLKEQSSQFQNTIQDYLQDWYNEQYKNYYTNPSAYVLPTLPTFQQFMNNQGNNSLRYEQYLKRNPSNQVSVF